MHSNVRTNTLVQPFHGALRSFAESCFQRIYRVTVWQVAQTRTNRLDRFKTVRLVSVSKPPVGAQIGCASHRRCPSDVERLRADTNSGPALSSASNNRITDFWD